jgi:hypothetical protein
MVSVRPPERRNSGYEIVSVDEQGTDSGSVGWWSA